MCLRCVVCGSSTLSVVCFLDAGLPPIAHVGCIVSSSSDSVWHMLFHHESATCVQLGTDVASAFPGGYSLSGASSCMRLI